MVPSCSLSLRRCRAVLSCSVVIFLILSAEAGGRKPWKRNSGQNSIGHNSDSDDKNKVGPHQRKHWKFQRYVAGTHGDDDDGGGGDGVRVRGDGGGNRNRNNESSNLTRDPARATFDVRGSDVTGGNRDVAREIQFWPKLELFKLRISQLGEKYGRDEHVWDLGEFRSDVMDAFACAAHVGLESLRVCGDYAHRYLDWIPIEVLKEVLANLLLP